MQSPQRMCARCVLPESFPGISFDENGICSECHKHERHWAEWKSGLPARQAVLDQLCQDARRRHKQFDALVPFSGGKDSTYVLYNATQDLGLHCLAFTLDNGYLSEHAACQH